MSDASNLIGFKAICNFTSDLAEIFGQNQKSLALYARLLKKTTIGHTDVIDKHINAFRTFCISNRQSIMDRNCADLVNPCIVYSSRVFIDLKAIFEKADKETKDTIWSHILSISAIVDPAGKAKEVLRSLKAQPASAKEDEFLSNIIEKVEKHVDPNAKPEEAISAILNSGFIGELVGSLNGGVSDGSLDLGKMMGSIQKMMGSLGSEGVAGGGMPMDMLNTMFSSMSALQK